MSIEIHKINYKAQPKVNREWWENLKEESEAHGSNASALMRAGAELVRASLDSGVVPECQIIIDRSGHIALTPNTATEKN
ncbi:hypothetical protein [Vibrio atypicus]|uniref:hypothetical protein n=1 Tax=Vibrio atypicus TaxID=558271 RepID=UPI0037350E29